EEDPRHSGQGELGPTGLWPADWRPPQRRPSGAAWWAAGSAGRRAQARLLRKERGLETPGGQEDGLSHPGALGRGLEACPGPYLGTTDARAAAGVERAGGRAFQGPDPRPAPGAAAKERP